jgi:ubiquinone biosynthesis accessory factor UbiK
MSLDVLKHNVEQVLGQVMSGPLGGFKEQISGQTMEQTVASLIENTPLQGMGENAKTFLVAALQKLDVVTREEYEVQVAVLARTREQLTALEAQVTKLEQNLS